MDTKNSRATHTFETSHGIEITLSHFLDSTWALSNARKVDSESGRWVSALEDPRTVVAAVAKTHAIGGKTLMKLHLIGGETSQITRIDVASEMRKNPALMAQAAAESKQRLGDLFSSNGMDFQAVSDDAIVLLSAEKDRTLALQAAHTAGAKQLMISSHGMIVIDVEQALLARARLSAVRDASTIAAYHRAYGLRQLDQSVFADIVITADFMREFRSKLGDAPGAADMTSQLLDVHQREHAVAAKATQSLFERLQVKFDVPVEMKPIKSIKPVASNFLVDGVRRFMEGSAEKKAEAAVKMLKASLELRQRLVATNAPAEQIRDQTLIVSSQISEMSAVLRSIKNPSPHLTERIKEVVTQARDIVDSMNAEGEPDTSTKRGWRI